MPETEHILASVEWETDSGDITQSLNAVANVASMVSNAFQSVISSSMQMMQSSLALVHAHRALRDAKRELNRESARQYQLDVQQSRLNVQIAQRELMIAQRTGRSLDIKQQELNLKKSIRDVDTTQMAITDKLRKNREGLYDAEKQLNIQQNQRILLIGNIIAQNALLITSTIKLITSLWAENAARAVKVGLLLGPLAVASAVFGAISIVKGLKTSGDKGESEAVGEGAQTGYGEVKKITKEGLVRMHEGEYVGRGGPGGGGVSNVTIKVPSVFAAARELNKNVQIGMLGKSTARYYTPPGIR